jgi:hypothetical protein
VKNHTASDSRSFTRALLNDANGGDLCWGLLVSRLHNLDLLSELEQMSLPWLYAHWQSIGRDVSALAIIRGFRRKMIVRNRILVAGAREIASKLKDVEVDAVFIKGAGLLESVLPSIGLRFMSDIDLWIRPSQQAKGFAELGAHKQSSRIGVHAEMMRDSSGRQIDIHIVPSHIFTIRKLSTNAAESMFEQAWSEPPNGRLSDYALVYFSILNNLFVHIPGEPRAAFCLFELDAILRHRTDPARLSAELVKYARRDDTVSVFVEHLGWIGSGSSPLLDELQKEMRAELTLEEQRRINWLQDLRSLGENHGWYSRQARLFVHAEQTLPPGVVQFVFRHIEQIVKSPDFLRNIFSIGSWKRLYAAAKDIQKIL